MTDKGLKNLYPRLRPNERFRLAVEAAARDDGHEFSLLSGSCPVHQYYATDEAYRSRLFAASYIAMHVANLLFRALAVEPAKLLALEPSCPPAWHSAVRLRGKGIASDPAMAEAVYKLLEGFWSQLLYDQDSWAKGAITS